MNAGEVFPLGREFQSFGAPCHVSSFIHWLAEKKSFIVAVSNPSDSLVHFCSFIPIRWFVVGLDRYLARDSVLTSSPVNCKYTFCLAVARGRFILAWMVFRGWDIFVSPVGWFGLVLR